MESMHLIFRTLLLLIRARRKSKLTIWDTSSLPLRALPTDVDVAVHINNGMYFSLMDLGRFDLMMRSGVWDLMRRNKWSPVVQSEQITFRRSINLWQQYTLETKMIGTDDKSVWFEQRFVVDGEIYVRAYVATRLVSKNGPVSNEEILHAVERELGQPNPDGRQIPEWLHQWRVDAALPSSRKPAPHIW